jgi:Flp pilus assembly protein TadG
MTIGCSIRQGERGSISVWLALSSFVMVFLVGLAVDLGGQVHAQQRGHDLAAQAARTGGEEVQAGPAIEGRTLAIDTANARAAARRYLSTAGVTGTVSLTGGDTLTVTVHDTYETQFLGLIGINSLGVTSTATAHLIRTLGGNPR